MCFRSKAFSSASFIVLHHPLGGLVGAQRGGLRTPGVFTVPRTFQLATRMLFRGRTNPRFTPLVQSRFYTVGCGYKVVAVEPSVCLGILYRSQQFFQVGLGYVGSGTLRRTPSYGPATGNEQGFLFYTTKGWEANKESLGEAYKAACKDGKYRGNLFNDREYVNGKLFINGKETPEGTPFVSDVEAETLWVEFEQNVEHHFDEFKKNLDKELMKAQLKLKYAKKYETPRTVAYWRRKVTELTNFVV